MEERRKMERYELNLLANIRQDCRQLEECCCRYMISSNISSCGAYLCTASPLAKDTRVYIDVFLPDKSNEGELSLIELKGGVVRSEEGGMAVRFDREEYRILRLCRKLAIFECRRNLSENAGEAD